MSAPRRPRGEQGFSLLAVLFGTMLFGLLAVVLLDLALASLRSQQVSSDNTAIERAVDGAFEIAALELKSATDPDIGAVGACDGDLTSPVTIDGITVELQCASQPSTEPEVYAPPPDRTVLALTGNFFGPLRARIAGNPLFSGFNPEFGGLIAAGHTPLRIAGDVLVDRGALVANQSASGQPGLRVDGDYAQRRYGWFGSTAAPYPCAVLDPGYTGIGANPGYTIESTGSLSCGSAIPAIPVLPAPHGVGPAQAATTPDLPACDPAALVITIPPGAYDRFDTQILNEWFGPFDACNNKIFHFPPGNYYFDVAGRATSDPDSRGALWFSDPTSSVVFGDLADPSPTTAVGQQCDPAGGNVAVVLSSRTTLSHKQGRVSFCGSDDPNVAVVYQAKYDYAAFKWAGAPTPGVDGATSPPDPENFVDLANATATSVAAPPFFPAAGMPWANTEATRQSATATCPDDPADPDPQPEACSPRITLRGFYNPTSVSPGGDIQSAYLRFMANSSVNIDYVCNLTDPFNVDNFCSTYRIEIKYQDGSSSGPGPDCIINTPRTIINGSGNPSIASNFNVMNVNLLDPAYGCNRSSDQVLVDAGQLEGAEITIIPNLVPRPCNPGPVACGPLVYSLDHAWLEVQAQNRLPATFGQQVEAPNRMMTFDGAVYAPSAQVGVEWIGATTNDTPLFGGGLTAEAFGSFGIFATSVPGNVVPSELVASERIVDLTAYVVTNGERRLRGSARMVVDDADGTVWAPGRTLEVQDFRLCNEPDPALVSPATARCNPN